MAPTRPVILLDTQIAVWLYEGPVRRIPVRVRRRLEREQLGLSPISQLELGCLHEIRRIAVPAEAIIDELRIRLELVMADISAAAVCAAALQLTWTRDPFDRLLAAHSIASQLLLVTADPSMRKNLPLACWVD